MRGHRAPVGAAILLASVTAPLAAQDNPTATSWFGKGLHTGLCIEFLVAPQSVRPHFGGVVVPTPVESLASRYPALARVAAAEATFRGWVPATYCWYLYGSGVARGRQFTIDDGEKPVVVGYLAIAATGLPSGSDAIVVSLFTNAGPFARAAGTARLKVEKVDLTVGYIPGEEASPGQRRYIARHGRTTIQWDGGPGTPLPAEPQSIRMTGVTMGNSYHGIHAAFTPDSAFTASGLLRVTGQGEVQALMAASPIRLVTSFLSGGDGTWDLGQ